MKTIGKLLGFCAIIALGILVYLRGCEVKEETETKEAAKPISVEVTTVKTDTVEEIIHTQGTLYARESASISPKMPGKIAQLLVDEGDEIKAGSIVAVLDDSQFILAKKQAEQCLLQARASFQNAENDYERMKELHEQDSIAKQKYDHVLTAYRIAEANLSQAKIAIELATIRLADTRIASPLTGTITRKEMNLGEMAAPGKPIFIVEHLDTLELKADLSSLWLGQVSLGLPARITVDGIDEAIMARIDAISPRVDKQLRSAEITVRLDNQARKLRPGLYARLELILAQHTNVLTVPRQSLLKRDDTTYVYRVRQGIAEKVPVKLGIRHGSAVEIIAGLNAEETIVTIGNNNLQGGERVIIQK